MDLTLAHSGRRLLGQSINLCAEIFLVSTTGRYNGPLTPPHDEVQDQRSVVVITTLRGKMVVRTNLYLVETDSGVHDRPIRRNEIAAPEIDVIPFGFS